MTLPRLIDPAAPPPQISSRQERSGLYCRGGKRALDVSIACAALLCAAPFMVVIGIVLRIALGRGLFYRQPRVGLNGEIFIVLKFRTMGPDRRTSDRDDLCGTDRRVTHKSADDPRHTRFGRMLRRSGLDEFPQLVNVLRGDMSVVGPRPELPFIVDRYAEWEHERHGVRPGITGLWQVDHRGTGPMHESVAIDLEYVRSVSLRGDLKILARTLPTLIRRTGA